MAGRFGFRFVNIRFSDPENEAGIYCAQEDAGLKWYERHGMIRNTVYACVPGAE